MVPAAWPFQLPDLKWWWWWLHCRYPCFENPYPMDLHESPVTACQYYANCPTDLIPAFYSVGSKQKKTGFSEKVAWRWNENADEMRESVLYQSCAVLFEVWECFVSELCCAIWGVRVFCIRVVLCCLRCEGVLCLCCAVWGVRAFCIGVVLFEVWECFVLKCESVLYWSCAVLFEVWERFVLELCCLKCESILYCSCAAWDVIVSWSCAVLFEVWECFVLELCCAVWGVRVVYLSYAVLFQVWGCFVSELCCTVSGVRVFCVCVVRFEVWECCVSELCCAVSGVADQRGPVGNNSSQLPWDYDYRVSMAALQSQPHANSVCGAIIGDEEYHPVEGTSGLNAVTE